MGGGSPRKFNPHENFVTVVAHETGMTQHVEDVEYQKTLCDKRLASAIAAESILDDSKPLGSGRPFSGRRYFRSAIVKVQAHVCTVIPYVANYSLAQFFVGLIFMGNARPQKLNSHENFCVYGMCLYLTKYTSLVGVDTCIGEER